MIKPPAFGSVQYFEDLLFLFSENDDGDYSLMVET
jgi:hypothetical protein